MPTSAQIALVYDFEHQLELAVKALFTSQNVKAFTSQMTPRTGDPAQDAVLSAAGWDLIDFQKDRPRVEIVFVSGAGQNQFTGKCFNQGGDSIKRAVETSFKGQLKIDVITAADMIVHSAARALARFILHTQLISVNGGSLPNHKIQSFYLDGGTSPVTKPEEGVFQTTMLIDLDFSVEDFAWELIAT